MAQKKRILMRAYWAMIKENRLLRLENQKLRKQVGMLSTLLESKSENSMKEKKRYE